MKIKSITEALDSLYPKSLSEAWDNDGEMLVLDREKEINKVLICLDVTTPVIDYAVSKGFDLILSHHPFIFKPLSGLTSSPKSQSIAKLIKNDISVLSYHTRFDSAPDGMNTNLARLFELTDAEAFGDSDECNMGRIGNLSREYTPEEYAKVVTDVLHTNVILYSANNKVKRVALLGGGGKDFIHSAHMRGADLMITGDISHGVVIDELECGISMIDAGHYGTEITCLDVFKKALSNIGVPEKNIETFMIKDPGQFILGE